ncbi:MAG: aminopeptidase P family N-terminal domain-containing protein, partial [Burkholderiaceae bacterium]|nr:aminopeptidase P family N-terminal domain-containing protein [Burkholderiaceae bacterium]
MQKQIIHERIDCLREVMRGSAVDAVLVFSADPHLSECPPAHWQTRQWLSGFTGSAGVLLLTKDFAGLWTDSRYHEQAAQQLSGTGIMAVPVPAGESHAYARWLTENLASGSVLSVSAWEISAHTGRALKNQMRGSDISLRTDVDLPGQIWADRPALPHSAVYAHSMDYAGKSRQEKLAAVREVMCQKEADWHFISALDDIAWLLNLRGADMPFSPLFLSHLLLGKQGAVLFVDADRVPPAVRDALLQDGIGLQAYDKAASVLTQLPSGSTVLMDAERVSAGMYQSVGDAEQVVESLNPTLLMKSRKTEKEIAHIRRTALCDGIALCEFFAWFEDAMACGDAITELDVAERLDDFRREQPGFVSPSFRSIVAFNANAALPHYQATADHNTLIRGNGLLLIDSGGQYLGGTTDITRVVPIGTPSAAQKRDFTLVLKGLIALSSACFPCGIPPAMLDAIAR